MTNTPLLAILLSLLLGPGCPNPYDVITPDDDDVIGDDDHDDDTDDDTDDDDDSGPDDDDDTYPAQDFPGSCVGQPDQPNPSPIADPELRIGFGSNGGHRGSLQVLDANGDGELDIISAENQQVTAYDPEGTVLWQGPLATRSWAGAVLANVDGQPGDEVVAADGAGAIHVWEANGPPLAGWPVQLEGHSELRSLAAADLDGDGADEIVVMATLNPVSVSETMYVLEGDGTFATGWPLYLEGDPINGLACEGCGGFNQNVAIADIEGNGTLDLVFTQDGSAISIFDAAGAPRDVHGSFDNCGEGVGHHWGEIRSYVPHEGETEVTCGAFDQIVEFTYSPPLIADLDHDGTVEIIAVGNLEDPADVGPFLGSALVVYQHARQHRPGFAPYHVSDGTLYPDQGEWHTASPTAVVANFRGNPELEILVIHVDGTARLYDASGNEVWSWTWATEEDCQATEPVVADLDGDLVPEAIVITACPDDNSSTLTVLGGAGDVRVTHELDFSTIAAPLLTDLDGDHTLEMLLVNTDFYDTVRIYDWPDADDSCVIWGQGRGDPAHTGWLR